LQEELAQSIQVIKNAFFKDSIFRKTSTGHTGLVPVSASVWSEWDSGTTAGMTFSLNGGF